MRVEIEAAVHFVGRVIISYNSDSISSFSEFKAELSKVMEERFKGHWHDDSPGKGQAYRSIRIHPTEPMDPVLGQAAEQSQFSVTYLRIPVELTMWVDPKDVSCRFGDLKSTYCTVLKNEDNQAGKLDVDELLENAKALYSRQQHFVVNDGPQPLDISYPNTNDIFGYGMPMNGYPDSYLFPTYGMYSPWYPDAVMDGSTPPPMPYTPPPMALSTTPRKNGKNGHFRKGSNGTGRGSKHHGHHHHHTHHHPHHHHHNGEGSYSNQNHIINNHNTSVNRSSPTGSSSSSSSGGSSSNNGRSFAGKCFTWMKGTKNFHQFYPPPPPPNHSFPQMPQQKHHPLDLQQTPPKKRQNSESDKDSK